MRREESRSSSQMRRKNHSGSQMRRRTSMTRRES
jgi:hypothetical protein